MGWGLKKSIGAVHLAHLILLVTQKVLVTEIVNYIVTARIVTIDKTISVIVNPVYTLKWKSLWLLSSSI